MIKLYPLALLLCCSALSKAQVCNTDVCKSPQMNQADIRQEINIPNIPGYITLKCDFHVHTVFSDGGVWPNIRATEAWQQGLDAFAITDHIEYRPHKEWIKADLNQSFTLAKERADALGLIAVKGTEITHGKPFGHMNALFITDANPMEVADPLQALEIALSQGAFIQWNHPGWPDNKSTVYDVHKKLIAAKKIHGIEVANYMEYYPSIITLCSNNRLAYLGNSDTHAPITSEFGSGKTARPISLVFAKERSEKGLKEAMFAGRAAALFDGIYFGSADLMEPLIKASLRINEIKRNDKRASLQLTNRSDVALKLQVGDVPVTVPANKSIITEAPLSGIITVLNCFTAENTPLTFSYPY